jgi:hypothetical protein
LAFETPGADVSRVEVLPRFMPRQRRFNVPGVVSVMVLPAKDMAEAPNPRPDQPLIARIHGYLSARRPLATELYVIGCEYVPLGVSVGITVRAGFGEQQVGFDVRLAVQRYLWSLAPHGPQGEGWPLGRNVGDRELEVVAAQVKGVGTVAGVNLFRRVNGGWQAVSRKTGCEAIWIPLEPWQLPELLAVVVGVDGATPDEMEAGGISGSGMSGGGTPGTGTAGGGVALPVVPEVC